jgi:hypothetical protein
MPATLEWLFGCPMYCVAVFTFLVVTLGRGISFSLLSSSVVSGKGGIVLWDEFLCSLLQ